MIVREVLLAYPDINAMFEIYTDTSKLQIGAVISQKGQANRFIFTKDEQRPTKIYHIWEKLLYIVAYLKDSRSIILGHYITVYTDDKNLTYENKIK